MVFSRAISIALFFVYILYLIFQLKTHSHLFRMTQSSMTDDIELEDTSVRGAYGT
jgi:Ca2+/H+ antiporter